MRILLSLLFIVSSVSIYSQKNFDYPKTLKSDTIDIYFDTKIPDPFRWLEEITSKKTLEWVSEQSAITDQYESRKRSLENGIYEKLVLYSYTDFKPLIKKGKFYFHFSYAGLESPPTLFYQKGINGISTIIIDPEGRL